MQTFFINRIIQGIFIVGIIGAGCKRDINRSGMLSLPDEVSRSVQSLRVPTDSTDQLYSGLKRKKSVLAFYESRNNSLAWCNNKSVSLLGDSMISMIKNIRYYGLLPTDYHLNEIEDDRRRDSENRLLRTDILLTDAFLTIAKNLKYGRLNDITKVLDDSLEISLLQHALDGRGLKSNLALQEPIFSQYRALKEALKLSLDTLKENDRRIFLNGGTNDTDPRIKKLQLIEINLERWRWENTISGDRYILVNIPSFRLEVFSNDTVVLDSKVIVGTPDRPTPLLSSQIECFIIYPYWHVPRRIAVEEYLPVLKKDPSFIKKNNFDVFDQKGNLLQPDSIEWRRFNNNFFPVRLRQREGPENSLGVLKFVFDNPYSVFLHDTNSKRLFRNEVRAFSHGCIRMEKASELAHYLVSGEVNKISKTIENYLKQRQRRTIDLPTPIPIHVRYFTCEFKHGVFHQYKDLYKRDQKLIHLFYEQLKVSSDS